MAVRWIIELICGVGILVLGFLLGGTAAFYKGWDEGFREGYRKDIEEHAGGRMKVEPGPSRQPGPSRIPSQNITTRKAS